MDTTKLSQNGHTRFYINKINPVIGSTQKTVLNGMLGPITSRNTRYVLADCAKYPKQFQEVGQVDVTTGALLDVAGYGSENTAAAHVVINAICK